jgi:hypothetical protein
MLFSSVATASALGEDSKAIDNNDDQHASITDAPSGMVLSIDTKNVYEGMNKSYGDGYLPKVSGGIATVVLPLLSEGTEENITVTVNLGDPANAPFVYINYEKQFQLKHHPTDNGETKCYLIQFSFELSANRVNGNYPITFEVRGETSGGAAFNQEFTLFVNISDGIDPHAPEPTPEPEPVQKPDPSPKLMVESFELDEEYLEAGEDRTLTVSIRNTSKSQSVQNIKLSYIEDSGDILPAGTGTQYIDRIPKDSSYIWNLAVSAILSARSGPHTAVILKEYEDEDGDSISASDRTILHVRRPARLEYEEPSLPIRVTQGDTPSFSMNLMNMGKSALHNVLLKFEIPGLSAGGSVLMGTILPWETQTGTTNFRVESKSYGAVEGILLLSYEDEYREYYENEIPLSTTIEKKIDIAPSPEAEAKDPASNFRRWTFPAAGVLLFISICIFSVRWLKEKKIREADEERL